MFSESSVFGAKERTAGYQTSGGRGCMGEGDYLITCQHLIILHTLSKKQVASKYGSSRGFAKWLSHLQLIQVLLTSLDFTIRIKSQVFQGKACAGVLGAFLKGQNKSNLFLSTAQHSLLVSDMRCRGISDYIKITLLQTNACCPSLASKLSKSPFP